MLFNGRTLIFTFSRTQVRIAEHERLQSLIKTSMNKTDHSITCLLVEHREVRVVIVAGRTAIRLRCCVRQRGNLMNKYKSRPGKRPCTAADCGHHVYIFKGNLSGLGSFEMRAASNIYVSTKITNGSFVKLMSKC